DADGADEDGVTFGTIQVGILDATVTVNVQGGNAKLDAWIDFDGDGNWGGRNEQIFASMDVASGDNLLTFDVPPSTIAGETYARFRLSSNGGLGHGGSAHDGEVEDYAVTILSPNHSLGVFAPQEILDITHTATNGAWDVQTADIDGDGDLDLVTASASNSRVGWHENDGNENFTVHEISTTAFSVRSIRVGDIDGDGHLDVVGANVGNDTIHWYQNDGNEVFTQRVFASGVDGFRGVELADLDGDGDLDVLSASINADTFMWHEYRKDTDDVVDHVIDASADEAYNVRAVDIDGDGDLDVLGASVSDDTIAWYENDGKRGFTKRVISNSVDGARDVVAADLDADGFMDVITASSFDHTIAWYMNDGSQNFAPQTLVSGGFNPSSVEVGDLDGDGDLDIAAVSVSNDRVAWLENLGDGTFESLSIISSEADVARRVHLADLDSDGDLDILSASSGDNKIAWYENITMDFGDAPDPYPTTMDQDGARHMAFGPRLGELRDIEVDGASSTLSDGDGVDEDGVMFGHVAVDHTMAALNIDLQNAEEARVDAWIDFNQDGDWDDPGEQILDAALVLPGLQTINYAVGSGAIAGETFARVRVSEEGGLGTTGAANNGEVEDYRVEISEPTSVVGRHVFYNRSFFDGSSPSVPNGLNDVAAIDPTKSPLLPGGVATSANYTNFAKGINGIFIDVANLRGEPSADDFEFRVGNNNSPSAWPLLAEEAVIERLPGAGIDGSDRIRVTWGDNVIEKQWLQVTLLANANTGLAAPDIHYWGNAIGDTYESSINTQVNATDQIRIRSHPRNFLSPAAVDDVFDINKDRFVNATDEIIARNNSTNFLSDLNLISAPS
ncbi:MAG: VCBS repeat-containing protein, partial [Planctomycetota bacterium]